VQVTPLVDETKLHDRIGVMMVGLAWRTYRALSRRCVV